MNKHTIETHKKNIFLKLEVTNNAELIKKAMMLGIIEL
ncbi:LuxR C-terminal-related transcriptional regulator [Empedobacter falsenii]